ncbi:MAG: ATP-dependent helicase [Nitrosopumilus sp.]|nr:ATP-dependent helicase [Nitrosopumilus sp.]
MTTGRITLSREQEAAISHSRGHLRIIACPGSGKTETVSRRVAQLVKSGVEPSTIVAFTFTVKAADELKGRIRGILETECSEKSDVGDMYVGTIDSFCLYMLKKISPKYKNFEVLDDARRYAFLDRWYLKIGIPNIQGDEYKSRTILKFQNSIDMVLTEDIDTSEISNRGFAECYDRYREMLKDQRFFDFASVIHTFIDLLGSDTDILRQVNDEIKHVVFDEYQDVNRPQERMLELLSRGAESVCVVGDDDQNIFQWRGSDVGHIRDFPKKYEAYGVTTRMLETNYRATGALVDMAGRLIGHNTNRVKKEMRPHAGQHNTFEHGDIFHRHFGTDTEEFGFICDMMQSLRGTGFTDKSGSRYPLSYRDMAVIVRTNNDAARIISAMTKRGIPCLADSGSSIFERPIVTLALDCLLHAFGHPGYDTVDIPDIGDLEARYAEEVPGGDRDLFKRDMERVRDIATSIPDAPRDWLPNLGLQEFYHRILSAMGAERGALNEGDMYNLAVLSKAISDYEYVYRSLRARQVAGLKWFIRSFAAASYADPHHADPGIMDAVRILTIWKAKGLEFPVVFLPSFDHRRSPPPQSLFVDERLYPRERYVGGEEDERRAVYTAVTRAQKYLFISGATRQSIRGTSDPPKRDRAPHRFLDEIKNGEFSEDVRISRPKTDGQAPDLPAERIPTSFSALSIYGRCPHDYLLRHVMGFSAGVPAVFNYGTNIHNILNLIHTDYIRHGTVPDDSRIGEMFGDMFFLRFAPGPVADNMKKAGIRIVRNYVDVHKSDFARILETEKRFEFTMDGALVSGSIDLLKDSRDGRDPSRIEIIDFKTNRHDKDARYELDQKEQVRFYAYAAFSSLGYRPEKAVIHHLDTGETTDVSIGENQLEAARAGAAAKIGKIASRQFVPDPESAKCAGCDFRALCQHKEAEVGAGFSPVRAERRDNSGAAAGDEEPSGQLGQSRVSAAMMKRAEELAGRHVRPIGGGTYEVGSMTDPGKTYSVTVSGCDCRGFKDYPNRHPGTTPTCSHVEAVKLFKKNS